MYIDGFRYSDNRLWLLANLVAPSLIIVSNRVKYFCITRQCFYSTSLQWKALVSKVQKFCPIHKYVRVKKHRYSWDSCGIDLDKY